MDFFGRNRGADHGGLETLPFLLWFLEEAERSSFVNEAQRVMKETGDAFPGLVASWHMPQGAPEHLEGLTVKAHIARMLTALFAIAGGAPLNKIEEFASAQHVSLDLEVIKHTLEEQFATFLVFTLLHDYGKSQTARVEKVGEHALVAPFELARKQQSIVSTSLLELYAKLYRAVGAELGDVPEEEIMIACYRKYGIEFEAPGHEKWFVNDDSVAGFAQLFETYRLTPRDIQLLKYLIRYHEVITDIDHHRAAATLQILDRAAEEYGLDGADARDALLCMLLIDHICGRIVLKEGKPVAQTDLLIHFVNTESHHFVEHRTRKRQASESRRRTHIKACLEESGLSVEELLRICQVPYTSARELFVQDIYAYIEGNNQIDLKSLLGAHLDQVIERLNHARAFFDGKGKN